jgi:hypothetical protein
VPTDKGSLGSLKNDLAACVVKDRNIMCGLKSVTSLKNGCTGGGRAIKRYFGLGIRSMVAFSL